MVCDGSGRGGCPDHSHAGGVVRERQSEEGAGAEGVRASRLVLPRAVCD